MKLKNGTIGLSYTLMPQKIEISRRTIVFTVCFLIFVGFVYVIRQLLLELFVAILIMTILNPVVNFLAKMKIPRTLAVLATYAVVIGFLVLLVVHLIPPLVEQSTNFVNGLPGYVESLGFAPEVLGDKPFQGLLSQIGIVPTHFAQFALSIFSNIIDVITVLIFAFYLLVLRNRLDDQFAVFFGDKERPRVKKIIDNLEKRLGSWSRGQLALMVVVGAFTYIGLRLLGLPFALPLSILAGLLEVVPYVGPILAGLPAVIIAFGISPVIGVATIALAFLIQQVENYFFVPTIMQKSVGLSSLMVLLSLAVGFKLAGVVGAIVSIPLVLTFEVFAKEFGIDHKKLA